MQNNDKEAIGLFQSWSPAQNNSKQEEFEIYYLIDLFRHKKWSEITATLAKHDGYELHLHSRLYLTEAYFILNHAMDSVPEEDTVKIESFEHRLQQLADIINNKSDIFSVLIDEYNLWKTKRLIKHKHAFLALHKKAKIRLFVRLQ